VAFAWHKEPPVWCVLTPGDSTFNWSSFWGEGQRHGGDVNNEITTPMLKELISLKAFAALNNFNLSPIQIMRAKQLNELIGSQDKKDNIDWIVMVSSIVLIFFVTSFTAMGIFLNRNSAARSKNQAASPGK